MSDLYLPTATLQEALRLLVVGNYQQGVDLYETLLRDHRAALREHVSVLNNLSAHKNFLAHRLALQMAAQGDHARGVRVNFGDYCFMGPASRDVVLSPKALNAMRVYKETSPAFQALRSGVLARIGDSPEGPGLRYYAHSVSSDIVDLCLLGAPRSMSRVADIGAGAGFHAATLAVMKPEIKSLHVFEIQDSMIEGIEHMFKSNAVDHYYLNRPIEFDIDFFYSFRACGYIFGIEEYFAQLSAGRSPDSWALFDISHQNAEDQIAHLEALFETVHKFYAFGQGPYKYFRTVSETPKRESVSSRLEGDRGGNLRIKG